MNMEHTAEYAPSAHVCFQQLVLPRYDSYEVFKEKLEFALTHAKADQAFHCK